MGKIKIKFCKACACDTERYESNGRCKPCNRARASAWQNLNPQKATARQDAWRAANPDRLRATKSAWYHANKSKYEGYYADNRGKILAQRAARRKASEGKEAAKEALYRRSNRERVSTWNASYRTKHRDKIAARQAAWYEEHKDRMAAYRAATRDRRSEYRVANRDRIRVIAAAWRKANPELLAAKTARRRAAKLQATPAWADHEAIAMFYAESDARTKTTGIPHEVDHIVPLQSPIVCGLHCEANLEVLTEKANREKGNRRWPDMP